MPQETPSKENNKSKPRFGRRRKSYVDSFRWGFVAEEEGNDNNTAKPEKKDGNSRRVANVREREKESSPLADSDSGTPTKQSRSRKKSAKKTTDGSNQRSVNVNEQEKKTAEPKKTANDSNLAGASSPKEKRPAKSRKRSKSVLPPYIAVEYDENDEDLKLPSYGRTPIPSDDELPVPQKIVRKTQPPKKAIPKSQTPKSGRHTPSGEAADTVSEVFSGGFRPRREQMVWDPDKSEYVPLVVTPKKTADGRRQTAAEEKKTADNRRQTVAKAPTAALPTREKKDGRRQTADSSREKKTTDGGKKSAVASPVQPSKERPQRNDSRRNRPPKFVDSSMPDPADIEAEVSGFAELGVSETMLEALRIVRYLEPTPIQAGVFQKVQSGTDLMGQAQTGTGKTAAFSIPIIEGVETCPPGNDPVALILVPTRELAVQVRDEAMRLAYGRDLHITACYGGKPLAKQIERLKNGIDILVGTPGRILDLMNRRALSLNSLRWVVLDEADRMLDIGFRPDIEKILKRTPPDRQTLLFSATLPQPVVRLAERYMKSPEVLDFSEKSVAVETIDQYYVTVDPERKFDALVYLLQEQEPKQAIIFTRTKRGADRLARLLHNRFENLAAIHGDLQQSERDRVMAKVRAGSVRYLVATDVVGRGIDVSGISHIINYDIPKFCDDYVHRVGRTGRMGRDGVAFTFVTVQEGSELTRIEMRIDKLLKRADLKGFESFTKPHDPDASLDDGDLPEPPKPVFGKPVRKVRRAL